MICGRQGEGAVATAHANHLTIICKHSFDQYSNVNGLSTFWNVFGVALVSPITVRTNDGSNTLAIFCAETLDFMQFQPSVTFAHV
jgi:hypothetical protein